MAKMTESALAALLDGQIADAVKYQDSDLSKERDRALRYYDGIMDDLPAESGKSSVVSHDVADTVGWIMPSLMRVFLASDRVVIYEPSQQGDEAAAAQATDYINYVFLKECDGYRQLRSCFYDGLLLGNGPIKHWWETIECEETESYSGLSDEALTKLLLDTQDEYADVEILEHSETQQGDEKVHACKIKTSYKKGQLRITALPPEEFLIERGATVLDETVRFCAHRNRPTRSELIEQGFEQDDVNNLPAYIGTQESTQTSRDQTSFWRDDSNVDKSVERVQIYECYVLCDYDGDGVAERRKVLIGEKSDQKGDRQILSNDEWGDDLPFSDIVPDPVPHRWRGRSIFDETQDVQRIKTVLMRQMLDNIYRVNNPQRQVIENQVTNLDALVNQEIGAVIFTKSPDAVRDLAVPFMAKESFPVLEYLDQVIERRTGISRASMALDPELLQNQTATAVNAQQSSSMSKVELYARNIAEIGLRRFFRCLLRLFVKHQDKPKAIRLRDKWVPMDPRAWNAEMDATVNVGLGAGTRDRDLLMLQRIAEIQKEVILQYGPDNPLSGLDKLRNTLAKMVEVSGMRSPEQFFGEIGPDEMQKISGGQAKPDPKMEEVKGKLQLQGQKMQGDAAMQGQKMQADMAMKGQEMQAKDQEMQTKTALEVRKQDMEAQLERERIQTDAAVSLQTAAINGHIKAATAPPVRMGGKVG